MAREDRRKRRQVDLTRIELEDAAHGLMSASETVEITDGAEYTGSIAGSLRGKAFEWIGTTERPAAARPLEHRV